MALSSFRAGGMAAVLTVFTAILPARADDGVRDTAASAEPGRSSKIGPRQGTGERRVAAKSGAERESVAAAPDAQRPRSHQVGPPPARPEPKLPAGVAPAQPDAVARRRVAGGPTDEERRRGPEDPELRELHAAEQVLFPKPLPGFRPGWSWDLPAQVEDGSIPVQASGLPGLAQRPFDATPPGKSEAAWIRSLTLPDLPVRLDARVVKYLEFYKNDPRGRRIARAWAKKSGRYAPALKAEFAKAGLPTDLIWLSLIESGHNPTIFSAAGAAGLWQFIPDSARMYGLTVDRWVDERLDPQRATDAAIRYLQDLRARFGSWELAMAAYNMGQGGLLRAVQKFNTNDFWTLSRFEAGVPWETALYVPKIMAIAIVMNNEAAFGLHDLETDPPISFDTVYVKPSVPLSDVARAAQVSEDVIRGLNASYLAERTPPTVRSKAARQWPVRVPSGRGLLVSQVLAKSSDSPDWERYVVRFGDTLDTIAQARSCTASAIAQGNQISSSERLECGTVLLVPPRGGGASGSDAEEIIVVPPIRAHLGGRRRVFYRVLSGDTVSIVATHFGVAASQVAAWNSLDVSANLQEGMTLQLFVEKDADLGSVRYISEDRARVLTAGTEDFFDYFEGREGRRRITVSAKEGDTLSGLGKRYGMSAGMMERINQFSRHKKLSDGDRVIVYTRQPAAGQSEADGPKPLDAPNAPRPELLPGTALGESSAGQRAVR